MTLSTTRHAGGTADLLKQHGIRPTRQRIAIADVLLGGMRHLSAEEIRMEANRGGAAVSKATVYNTLNLFLEHELVKQVVVDGSRVFYDSNMMHHYHFYNEDTGELTDIPADQLRILELPEPPSGTVTSGMDIVIRVRPRPD